MTRHTLLDMHSDSLEVAGAATTCATQYQILVLRDRDFRVSPPISS